VTSRPPSLGAAFWSWYEADSDACCLIDPGYISYSRADFARMTQGAARRLADLGVGAGDRVLALAENHVGLLAGIFGCWHEGAIVAPFDPTNTGQGFQETVRRVDPAVVIVDDSSPSALGRSTVHVEELAAASPTRSAEPRWHDGRAISTLIFSSGTTGAPKACALSNEYLVWVGESIIAMSGFRDDDRMLTLGPFHHSSAFSYFAPSVLRGTPHAFDVRFSASRFWERVRRVEATAFDYIGAIVAILLRTAGVGAPSLRVALGSGARAADAIAFEERFGVPLIECYGLTECLVPIYQSYATRRPGCVGHLSDVFEARLVDEHRVDVPDGEAGELLLLPKEKRTVFDGYWGDEQATADAFADGWFRTRDLLRRDEDGQFVFVDRLGQVIRRRGENISAWELEGTLLQHPAIRLCAAIGVASELGEEDVLAAVELEPGASLDPDEFLAWASGRLPRYMVPRYLRITTLPLTASERVQRRQLRVDGVTADTLDLAEAREATVNRD
jgi:crotonobetaine/carnitine-CoA ligase